MLNTLRQNVVLMLIAKSAQRGSVAILTGSVAGKWCEYHKNNTIWVGIQGGMYDGR